MTRQRTTRAHERGLPAAKVIAVVVAGWLGLSGGGASAADPLAGLITRPANPTCVAGERPASLNGVRFQPVFTHLTPYKPFHLQQSPADPATWYFSTRDGKVYSFIAPTGTPRLVLDVSNRVGVLNRGNAYSPGGSEQWGISSFALHPNFARNGNIFVQVNGRQASEPHLVSMLMRYTLVATPAGFGATFDRSTETRIISQQQTNPGVTHHWGHTAFGPGGLLFIGSGDGTQPGAGNRPRIPAQNCADLRGKILRINVNHNATGAAYTIPPDNPYANSSTCRQEIFAMGFRNPWRFSLDGQTQALWVGDVGADRWEEVDLVADGGNYGWPIYEGNECLETPAECARPDLVPPISVTARGNQSAAVIGGFVYRGTAIPSLAGDYIYSIFPRAELLVLRRQPNGTYQRRSILAGAPAFSSYFTDAEGEIYGITGHSQLPQIQKLIPDAVAPADVSVATTLSTTGCFTKLAGQDSPRIVGGAIPYEVISPLWSSGSEKRRWVALPDGARITIGADGDFGFPSGTVLIKEFSYGGSPFETRLLKRHDDGIWLGYSYAWRGDLSDADLVPAAGMTRTIASTPTTTIAWRYPSRGQCMECHTAAARYALGPEVLQLNNTLSRTYPETDRFGNQLATWAAIGLFTQPLPRPVAELPSLVDPAETRHSPISRARSYLHANCAGCHRPNGPTGNAIDLRFQARIDAMNVCHAVQTAGDIVYPGASILTPQNPSLSALSLRVHAAGRGAMPPIGRALVDATAASVIDAWINRADVCVEAADSDGDGVPDNIDNCQGAYNPAQADNDGDRFGNRCDGDWNGNLVADRGDRAELLRRLGIEFRRSPLWLDKYDLNGDGIVDDEDVAIFDNELLNRRPGPSATRR